jgi:hypothetical protein
MRKNFISRRVLSLPMRFLACLLALTLAVSVTAQQPKKEKPFAPGGKWRVNDPARPRPRVISPPSGITPPSDAIVLFNGKDLANWKNEPRKDSPPADGDKARWIIRDGVMECAPKSGSIRTREKYEGDQQWHIEWATPSEVKGNGQGRGNSGVFIGGFPEIQVLDSYQNDTYPDGQAGGLYGHYPPMVNASRKPGEWQTYDIIVERQKKDAKGNIIKKARLTVIHNGVVIHLAREFDTGAQASDLQLQDHTNPVQYRNIWVRKLNLDDPDSEGTPPPTPKKP